jgi:MSHA biogenesis protein MshP
MNNPQRGFSIVSAIFLLVVLAFLGTAMVTFSVNQQQTAALDVAGERAYQAARAGIEWGAFQALQNGVCAANTNLAPLAGTLSGFSVTVTCAATAASEVSAATGIVTVYDLTSTASQGTPGQPDRVERQVQASIAK